MSPAFSSSRAAGSSRPRLEALATEHGGKVEEYGGKRLITPRQDATATRTWPSGSSTPTSSPLAATASVKNAIDAGRGNNVVSNTELMRQINEFDNSNAWAVGRFDAMAQGWAPSHTKSAAQVPAIQWFSAAGHINGGVSGVIKAEARDEESAKNLHDILNGFLAMAKMQAGSRPEIKTVVDSLQLAGDGKNISLSFSLPSELIDALEAMKKQPQQ